MRLRSVLESIVRADAQPNWQGTVPLTSNVILNALGLGDNGTSVTTPEQAMAIAAVARATQILAGGVAGAPREVITTADGKPVVNHRLVFEPHPMMDDFAFWELAMLHMIYEGNFYGLIKFEGPKSKRTIKSITPLNPKSVHPKAVVKGRGAKMQWTDTVYVMTLEDGTQVGLPSDEVFHLAGLGFDGLAGISLLKYARNVLESTNNSDVFANKFYSNGSLMSGVLTTDKRLDETAAEGLKQRWRKKVQGINNAFDIVVLDSATRFEQISLSPQDAQWLEARKFNVHEIARIFGVHPQLLMELSDGVSESGTEMKSADFVAFTLDNWTNRISASASRQILPDGQRLAFHTKQLVQPDMRTRSSAAVMWRKAQVKSINELRQEEGLPALDDPRASDPFYIEPKQTGGAAEPGGNQGEEEQPVPADQEPTGDNPQDNNLED